MRDLYPLLAVQVVHRGWSMNRLKLGVVTTAISRPRRARIASRRCSPSAPHRSRGRSLIIIILSNCGFRGKALNLSFVPI